MVKRICFLAYEGVELLDLSGPQSAFHEAEQVRSGTYQIQVVGFDKQIVTCEAGLQIIPSASLNEIDECHTLIIPGGKGSRSTTISACQLEELSYLMSKCERIVSICTGAYLMARAGLPCNTEITTHWNFIEDLQNKYPDLNVNLENIYVNDGRFWSSAGVTSGIDLTLKLIELDLGKDVAHQVAKYLVIYLKRSGNQKQYSDLLDMQAPKTKRMETVSHWIREHIGEQMNVANIANIVHLSERQCHRMFLSETNNTPAQYIEKCRMQLASELLITSDTNIKAIALKVGYNTTNGFNRAFERNFSVTPTAYRKDFLTKY